MSRIFFFMLAVVGLAVPSRADLAASINGILQDKSLKKIEVGVAIARLSPSGADMVFELNAAVPRMPASNVKLLTTSAFLEKLGPDFKFRTILASKGDDLYLIGDGDPTLGDAEMLRKVGWDVTTVFKSWAGELKARGSKTVRNVIVDDSVFDDTFVHPNWPDKQMQFAYQAEVGGVNLNVNCLDIFIRLGAPGQVVSYQLDPPTKYVTVKNKCVAGSKHAVYLSRTLGGNEVILAGEAKVNSVEPFSVTIHDPGVFAATVLAETLAAEGIAVTGSATRGRAETDAVTAAALETQLSTVLARANKDSVNLYAEAMCKRLGRAATNEPGSWKNGTAAVGAFLKQIGTDENQFHLDDGCGLSRENNASPGVFIKVLAHNFHSKNFETFRASLAVAGADGTLAQRFNTSPLKGRVFAKSGYIGGVSALSGYLKCADDRWYAFSFLLNNVAGDANPKQVHEKILAALDRERP